MSMGPFLYPDPFKTAALLMEAHPSRTRFTCNALFFVMGGSRSSLFEEYQWRYAEMFKKEDTDGWAHAHDFDEAEDESPGFRIMCLNFAAAMAETGDL